ncbi:MAG: hypothetical protein DRG20_04855 [Deltaproteobacteria bacterium]|nr:MAG: hypothetical protein DRG20_04855 [Deltaproteobacteria bacterium]
MRSSKSITRDAVFLFINLKTYEFLKVTTLIDSIIYSQEVLYKSMKLIEEFLGAEKSLIFQLDSDRDEIFYKFIKDGKEDETKEIRFKIGEGIAGFVAATRKPFLSQNIRNDPHFSDVIEKKIGIKTNSLIAVPLESKDTLIGVIEVINKKDGKKFDSRDLKLLLSISELIGIAINNAFLYEKIKKKFEITDHKLKITKERLLSSEKLASLGSFANAIAHEVLNPVMVIAGFIRRIQKITPSNDLRWKYLIQILPQLERLERVVHDIANFAEMEPGTLSEGDINTKIRKVVSNLLSIIKQRGITIDLKLKDGLPHILMDKRYISLAIFHILMNSIEAMPNGGKIMIKTDKKEDNILVEVIDTGKGIKAEHIDKVFNPFFTSKTKSTGLGMTIVNHIISYEHGGKVEIESKEGKGTKVRLLIPTKIRG